jgi:hypothetical protein
VDVHLGFIRKFSEWIAVLFLCIFTIPLFVII